MQLVSAWGSAAGIAQGTASATPLGLLLPSGRWPALGIMSGPLTALPLANIDILTASTREDTRDRRVRLGLEVESMAMELPLPLTPAASDLENQGSATRAVGSTGKVARVTMRAKLMDFAGHVMRIVDLTTRGPTLPLTHAALRGLERMAAMRLLETLSAASCARHLQRTRSAGPRTREDAKIESSTHWSEKAKRRTRCQVERMLTSPLRRAAAGQTHQVLFSRESNCYHSARMQQLQLPRRHQVQPLRLLPRAASARVRLLALSEQLPSTTETSLNSEGTPLTFTYAKAIAKVQRRLAAGV